MLRILDIFLSATGLLITSPILLVLYMIGLYDTGSPLFKQERVGQYKRPFILLKFRTMRMETPQVATHLITPDAVTPLGRFLRRTKLDELPQLWNVLRGEMSLVGPRPCLFAQNELIQARDEYQVFDVRPGITGLAQVHGVDMSDPSRLAAMDARMLQALTMKSYLCFIIWTATGRGAGDRVRH